MSGVPFVSSPPGGGSVDLTAILGAVSLADYGAVGDNVTLDTAAIDEWLAAIPANGVGIAPAPDVAYRTDGGHVIPKGVTLLGMGLATFKLNGNATMFTYDGEGDVTAWSDPSYKAGLEGIRLWGPGSAHADAVGLVLHDTQHFHMKDVWIGHDESSNHRFNGTNAVGLLLQNTDFWNENLNLDNVKLQLNTTNIAYLNDAAVSKPSMGYHRYRAVTITVGANQTGMNFGYGGANPVRWYSGDADVTFWLQGDDAVAIDVESGSFVQHSDVRFRGEVITGTDCLWLRNAGTFTPRGLIRFPFGTDLPGVDLTGAVATDLSGGVPERQDRLQALGVIAESIPLDTCGQNSTPTSGRMVVCYFHFRTGEVVQGITIPATVTAAGLTEAFSVMYRRSDNVLVASSADLDTSFNGVAVPSKVDMPFSAPYVVEEEGLYGIGFLFIGATPPGIVRAAPGSSAPLLARTGTLRRWGVQTGLAAKPDPMVPVNPSNGDAFGFEVY